MPNISPPVTPMQPTTGNAIPSSQNLKTLESTWGVLNHIFMLLDVDKYLLDCRFNMCLALIISQWKHYHECWWCLVTAHPLSHWGRLSSAGIYTHLRQRDETPPAQTTHSALAAEQCCCKVDLSCRMLQCFHKHRKPCWENCSIDATVSLVLQIVSLQMLASLRNRKLKAANNLKLFDTKYFEF